MKIVDDLDFGLRRKSLKKGNQSKIENNIFPRIYKDNNTNYFSINNDKIINYDLNRNNKNILFNNNVYDNIKNININTSNNNDEDKNRNLINNNYGNKNNNEILNLNNNNNISNNVDNNNRSNSQSKNDNTSYLNNTSSQLYDSSIKASNRSSINKDIIEKDNIIYNMKANKGNKKSNIFNHYARNSKKIQKKYDMAQWNSISSDPNSKNPPNVNNRPVISPYLPRLGVNYVGLNIDNNKESDDDYDCIRISCSGNKLKNLRLEGIGVSSPNSQKITRKKIRLQGISSEAPLKISAAFGRTAYTFFDNNNEKNKLYKIKMEKQNKNVEKNNLDICFAPNNK